MQLNMLDLLLGGRARLMTHVVGWLLLGLLFFGLFSSLRGPGEALSRTALNLVFLVLMFYVNAKVLVNRFLETGRYRTLLALTLVFWLGMAALRSYAETELFSQRLLSNDRLPPDGGLRMFLAYALSFFLLLLFSTLYQLLENRYLLELKHRRLEAQHAGAQLDYLRAQINPHFLFNTLHNIYAAANLQHPNTPQMVLRLSELLRYVTYEARETQAPLSREIEQLEAYLELYRLQADRDLHIRFDQQGDPAPHRIAPILLLPLLENALKHGNLAETPEAWLRISLSCGSTAIQFEVVNTFNPDNRQKDATGGVGLTNIRRRLELLYPQHHRLDTQSANGIFTAQLHIDRY